MSDIVEQAREDAIFIGNLRLSRNLGTNSRRTNSLLAVAERLLSRLAEVEKERDLIAVQHNLAQLRAESVEHRCNEVKGQLNECRERNGALREENMERYRERFGWHNTITTLTAENAKMREALENLLVEIVSTIK